MTSQTGFKFCDNQNYPNIPDGNTWTSVESLAYVIQKNSRKDLLNINGLNN